MVADDWATFLRDRLDGRVPLTGGIEVDPDAVDLDSPARQALISLAHQSVRRIR